MVQKFKQFLGAMWERDAISAPPRAASTQVGDSREVIRGEAIARESRRRIPLHLGYPRRLKMHFTYRGN